MNGSQDHRTGVAEAVITAHSDQAPPLTDQIGPSVVALIVVSGAVAAGIAAFRAAKIHLHMAVEPSATTEPERAQELPDQLRSALTNDAAAAPVPIGVATTAVAVQAAVCPPPGGKRRRQ